MQSINHEFTRPASPQVPYLSPSPLPNKNIFVQTSFDGSTPANKIIHVTNYNNNNNNNNNSNNVSPTLPPTDDAMLEESCDSYLDSDNEDASMQGNQQCGDVTNTQLSFISALNKATSATNHNGGVKTECLDPYHIPPRFQSPTVVVSDDLISPQKELKNLIKEVEISNVANHEYSPIDSPVIDKLTEEVPRIEIVEEPETTYRARYESEGCKGPIHGSSETGFPSVKIVGYVGEVLITVYVVTRDNEPHLHTATGPGSTKSSCKEIVLDDGTPAVQMILKPIDENDDMVAVFDQLSVRRVRNWEADRELRKRGIEPSSWKSKKKEAKLAFQAAIKPTNYHPGYVLTTYSRTFLCTAPSGNPEIWWASLSEGSPEGGEELGLIGKKFASGFKIRFFSKEDDGEFWEVFADVDRAKSNLNACVVKVPPYKETVLTENMVVYVEIRVGPEKEPRCSDPYPFTYLASKTNDKCDNCVQIKGLLQRVFAEKSGDGANGLSLRVQNPNVLNGGLVHVESTKIIPTSSLNNATKTISQTQVTNYNSVANIHPAGNNISPAILPLLQPYVVKTGDMVSIVGSGTRTDTTNNVGVLYVQKVAENNNIPIMFQGTKPIAINNTLNLTPQKVMLSSQPPTQNINMTVPKIIVPQTLNNVPVSLTNHIPLPSIVQVCSINTSAHPTVTRTAAGVTNLQQAQLIHVVSQQGLAVSQAAPQNIPNTHFILNGIPVQTHHQFVNSNTHQVFSKTGPMISTPTYDLNLQRIQSSKVPFVNSNNALPNLVYVKTDNAPMFSQIKEEESPTGHLSFQPGSTFTVDSRQPGSTFTVDSRQTAINTSNNNINNINHHGVNRSQTTTIFASQSLTPAVCTVLNQSHPLGCQTITPATQSPNTIQQLPSSVMLHSGSQTVQLTPNTGILQHDDKDMQIISTHLQNLQKELEVKEAAAASSIQYKIFPGQKVSPFGSQASFVPSNVTEPFNTANRSMEIVTTVTQPIQAQPVQHFDAIATQSNHELNRSAEMNQVEGITQFQTDEQKLSKCPFQMLQNIPNNPLLGQRQNPGAIQSAGEQATIGSTNSINSNASFPNQVQDMFVVSPLLQPRSVVNTSHVSQLQQLPTQQPIALTVFNQSPMMPTAASNSDVFTQQQVHNETSPTQLSTNSYQPLQISHGSQESQLLHHQQLFTSPASNHSISNSINHMDDITRVESHWERRPSITDAIESNKVGFIDSSNCVKDSNPASPMVLNIEKYDTEENNFMETLQQLNNDPQEYSSMPPTPAAVTFGTSTFDTNSQQISQIDSDLVDQDEFGASNVSVDYSDAFKSARACESSNSWPFQKTDITDIDRNPYIQDVTMFPPSSSVQSLSISSQPGW